MAEVLVLVDHLEGKVKKSTYELLTAAWALGEPAAVVVGPPGTVGRRDSSGHLALVSSIIYDVIQCQAG